MSNTLLATVVVAGVVGASSAAVTAALVTPSNPEPRQSELAGETELVDVEQLASDLGALRSQNEALRARVVELEMHASLGQTAERREPLLAEPDPEVAQMKEELAALLATMRGSSDVIPPNFTATVSTALEQIRDQEEQERRARREEVRAERIDERLNELAVTLGLSPNQVNDLREHVAAFDEKRRSAFEQARELGDFGSMRETMRTMRTEQETALQGIFSPAQYQQYQDEDLGRGLVGGPDFGGRGGGRFGGGGGGGQTDAPANTQQNGGFGGRRSRN